MALACNAGGVDEAIRIDIGIALTAFDLLAKMDTIM